MIITLLNDSKRSLNIKWLRPVTNKSNPPLVENQSKTPFLPSALIVPFHIFIGLMGINSHKLLLIEQSFSIQFFHVILVTSLARVFQF